MQQPQNLQLPQATPQPKAIAPPVTITAVMSSHTYSHRDSHSLFGVDAAALGSITAPQPAPATAPRAKTRGVQWRDGGQSAPRAPRGWLKTCLTHLSRRKGAKCDPYLKGTRDKDIYPTAVTNTGRLSTAVLTTTARNLLPQRLGDTSRAARAVVRAPGSSTQPRLELHRLGLVLVSASSFPRSSSLAVGHGFNAGTP